jgi:hypothetical protein
MRLIENKVDIIEYKIPTSIYLNEFIYLGQIDTSSLIELNWLVKSIYDEIDR